MIQIDVQKLEEKIHIEYHISMEAAHERTLQVEKKMSQTVIYKCLSVDKGR